MIKTLVILSAWLFEIFLLLSGDLPAFYNEQFLWYISILNLTAIFSYSFSFKRKSESQKYSSLRFTTLYIIGAVIVCYQPFFDLIFGYLSPNNTLLFINSNSIIKVYLYTSIALNGFLLGVCIANKNIKPIRFSETPLLNPNLRWLKLLNGLFFFLFLSQVNSEYLNSTLYGGGDRVMPVLQSYAMLFFDTSFISLILLIILHKGNRTNFIGYVRLFGFNFYLFFVYLIFILQSGDRGPVIYLSLAFLFGYIYLNNISLSKVKLFLLIILMAAFITILGVIRRTGGSLSSALNSHVTNSYYPESFSPMTKELAGSILTVSTAVNSVPNYFPHTYGLFMFQNVTVLIPGLNNFLNTRLAIPSILFSSPRFLTYLSLGPNSTWGIGTSAVADVYLDFGIIGIIIVFFLFGYWLKRIEILVLRYKSRRFGYVAMYLLFFSFSIYISRSNLVVPFTKFAYIALFYHLVLLNSKKKQNYLK